MKNNLSTELIRDIIMPAMQNFTINGIIEKIMPTFSKMETKYECLILNCIMVMIATERRYPHQFQNEEIFPLFTQFCLDYYESEKLYIPSKGSFDREAVTKDLFKKFSSYESALAKLSENQNFYEIAKMIYRPQIDNKSVSDQLALNTKRIQLSILQSFALINEKLPTIISNY